MRWSRLRLLLLRCYSVALLYLQQFLLLLLRLLQHLLHSTPLRVVMLLLLLFFPLPVPQQHE